MKIPFQEYSYVNRLFRKEFFLEVKKILDFSTNSDFEDYNKEFEKEFSEYVGTEYAVGVDSGTTALQLSLLASGVGRGDEVILPVYTYIGTALAVSNIGAKPVFVDVKEDLTIDEEKIEPLINDKTKAIIPVHIHGNVCEMDRVVEIAKNHNLGLIEDASQAHGANYKGKKVGSFGLGCFSLHTSKLLGGVGDGGVITLNDEEYYKRIKTLMVPDNDTKEILHSGRTPCDIDSIQAAMVKVKLGHIDKLNKRKREIAKIYDRELTDSVGKLRLNENAYNVYRDYCIRVEDRDKLLKSLYEEGIETKARYKTPLHLTNTFGYLGCKEGDFPVAERLSKEVLCLPCFVGLSDEKVKNISKIVNHKIHGKTHNLYNRG